MKKLVGLVKGLCSILDKLAGICIFAVMLLIVANIILRTLFNRPILGTYELVGFLTAMGVALALAHCAFQDGHVAISFIVERFGPKIQVIIAIVINAVSFMMWAAAAWSLGKLGYAMKVKGLVSPSAEIPVYPFIYLIAFGLLGLSLVVLFKLLVSCRGFFENDMTKKVAS
ncbi:TRAP transporter small permease [Desulfosporosinus sp. OT]|uniref:TRAP transporter small permease n=1 Tax=Desulfosporosinus sp. OT TaxID=913865 RepID=UPI000223AD3D|nr:TRAP transporter small permease [Desulfosporosinus sp. OT]EGW41060.1 putative membrane protein [Desulfosporosinus sp. OT]